MYQDDSLRRRSHYAVADLGSVDKQEREAMTRHHGEDVFHSRSFVAGSAAPGNHEKTRMGY
jgi:hypothetical protein